LYEESKEGRRKKKGFGKMEHDDEDGNNIE
jgi:hypothetical protein